MKELAAAKITILGLGLMGGSLAAALSGRCAEITAYDPDPSALESALSRRWIFRAAESAPLAVKNADLVVLAAPVRAILTLLDQLSLHFPSGCVVMDLGSTKTVIADRMALLPEGIHPLGGHPMCGKEFSGIQAAEGSLFQGQTFILTPIQRTPLEALRLANELVRAVGATPIILTPQENDQFSAFASHLPFLLSAGLVETVRTAALQDPRLWQITASGYRDTSRLAGGDVTMMMDILLTNRDAVLQAFSQCRTNLDRLAALVDAGDEQQLRELLELSHHSRKEWKA